jgi:hypothetical protein
MDIWMLCVFCSIPVSERARVHRLCVFPRCSVLSLQCCAVLPSCPLHAPLRSPSHWTVPDSQPSKQLQLARGQ